MKLGVKHPWLKYYNVYINHDPVMTLTKFMARSTWVAHAFEWEKLLKCHLKGKASKKLANGQNIDYSEKRKRPKGFICPCTGVKYHNIQTCLLVYAADSGERLQDHWSSGFMLVSYFCIFISLYVCLNYLCFNIGLAWQNFSTELCLSFYTVVLLKSNI